MNFRGALPAALKKTIQGILEMLQNTTRYSVQMLT